MQTINSQTPLATVLNNAEARRKMQEIAPEVLQSPMLKDLSEAPTGSMIALILGERDARRQVLLDCLAQFPDTTERVPHEDPIEPATSYEGAGVVRASARVVLPKSAEQRQRVDVVLHGPSHGNPFVDVDLSATFTHADDLVTVGGFYDGDGRYVLRFLPLQAGEWAFKSTSTTPSLDGLQGVVTVVASAARGPVRVVDAFHFAHADGSSYRPLGTTAYAWIHQDEAVQDATVATLNESPFTKLRMCLFPKHFLYNAEEPERFVFERSETGEWDTTRFDLQFFANLERRLEQLEEAGVQADLILFHPYDRWGFARLSDAADDRYVRYVVRRLAGFPNVWWSMANEYDLLPKPLQDWHRLASLVRAEDHVGHPLSIHNWIEVFDYSTPWATHASLQRGDYKIGEMVDVWRATWGKPVLLDEFGYEGDLDQGWGNLMAEEVVRRFWEATLRGGYLTHGETYWDEKDRIWWSKGGELQGQSPARIAFLDGVVAQAPAGRLEPLTSNFDDTRGGVAGEYEIIYFGASRPRFRDLTLPEGASVEIDVIDTWNMTVTPVTGVQSGAIRVQLPAQPYVAIRLRF